MKLISGIEKILKNITMVLFSLLVTVVCFQILSRFITGKSFAVVEELSMFLLAWCSFLAAAYTARKKSHVRVEYFVDKFLPPRGRALLELVSNSTFLVMLVIIIRASIRFVGRQMRIKMVVLPVSKGLMYLSFPVGMIFFMVFVIGDIIHLVQSIKSNRFPAAGKEGTV